MPGLEALGPALRRLRVRAGLSQRELAARCRERVPRCGVTQAMLSQWERGEQQPSWLSLDALLTSLELGLDDLHRALAGQAVAVAAPPAAPAWVRGLANELGNLEARLARLEAQIARPQAETAAAGEEPEP